MENAAEVARTVPEVKETNSRIDAKRSRLSLKGPAGAKTVVGVTVLPTREYKWF